MAARGRVAARRTIVANVMPAANLAEQHYVLRDIHRITDNVERTIEWLAERGLLSNSQLCCNENMGFVSRERCTDGRAWYCKHCKKYRSIRTDSFFAGSHMPLGKIVELIYWWADIDAKQTVIMKQVGIATECIVNWCNYLRDICAMWSIDHPIQLGGNGAIVEIDESKFMHRKYHRGRWTEGHWVLGLIERGTLNTVLVPVEDRSAATLLPIIARHVQPNTRIITDGWRVYQQLANHQWVNHRFNFVDPNNPEVHTNTIEGTWAQVKTKYRAMRGTSDELFNTYLQEYGWRKNHRDNIFMHILFWIRHYYPL